MKSSFSQKIAVLGTGGTIAGRAVGPKALGEYKAAEVSIETLLASSLDVGLKPHFEWQAHQVCQIDSKDLGVVHWQKLLARLALHWADPEIQGILITHGTDTLEETAFLLSWLMPQDKPVVLTGAMRAFDAHDSDGSKNLKDAFTTLERLMKERLGGVWVVMAGQLHPGADVQKMNATSLNAFESKASGTQAMNPQSHWSGSLAKLVDVWPFARPSLTQVLSKSHWPRVEVVMSHAGVEPGGVVLALLQQLEFSLKTKETKEKQADQPSHSDQGVLDHPQALARLQGLVVSGTGSGTWAESLREPLLRLMRLGVTVVFTSRVPWGHEACKGHPLLDEQGEQGVIGFSRLSPLNARIALALHLMVEKAEKAE